MSAPRVAVTPGSAISQLAFLLGYEKRGELPVYADGKPNALHRLPCADILHSGLRLGKIAARLDLDDSAEVAIGLPLVSEFVYSTTVLWAHVETKDSAWRASQLKIAPGIVLKMGASAKRLLLWPLRQPVTAEAAEAANRRLAYALHSPQTRVKPEKLRVNLPGTFLRVGRTRPAAVVLTRLEDRPHTEGAIVGRLKSPPAPYMERLRNGEVPR